ncbi:hypothetical protein [Bacillus sp. FJAT-22090]|uniref:hypothetical protein n=1 Tax=Bacillus sp. FJAT-22090 TaxID=1581038 RepID=UPI0011A8D88D|nr:hypothetical protein [Bacillus sp. FJAT-22090]
MIKENYFPKDWDDFTNYLTELEEQTHGYNSIADALTLSTVAFFNYFASKHGMTGFQASWSGLQFIKTTRNIDAPFMIVDSSKLLYPQYDLEKDVHEFLENSKKELAAKARENLKDVDKHTNSKVIERWKEIAEYNEES